jgi:hypothetical protein
MAQAEPTTVTGEQVLLLDSGGGVCRPILGFPIDRGLVTGASGDGKRDGVGVEKSPDRISLRPFADSDGERRWHERADETLDAGADGTCDRQAEPERAAKPASLVLGTPGVVRQAQQRPVADFDVNAVADDRGRNRRPERAEAIPEGL